MFEKNSYLQISIIMIQLWQNQLIEEPNIMLYQVISKKLTIALLEKIN